MKAFWTLFTALMLTFGLASTADAARFGSGGFGKAKPVPFQQKKATPDQTRKQQPANSTRPGSGLGKGLLGGLLAGGLFAYLLGSGAFEGIQMMDILLLALVGFVLFKLLRSRAAQHNAPRSAYSAAADHAQQRQSFDMANLADSSAAPVSGKGAAFAAGASIELPAGFDQQAFIDGALQHYRQVQEAWNQGNLDTIAEYVSPDLYAALANQRNRMLVPPQTEVLDLSAEIVAAGQNGNNAEISLLFKGRVRDLLEKSEDGIFDIWHLERDLNKDNAPWLIVGIQAE